MSIGSLGTLQGGAGAREPLKAEERNFPWLALLPSTMPMGEGRRRVIFFTVSQVSELSTDNWSQTCP